jgi:hypothetical protein
VSVYKRNQRSVARRTGGEGGQVVPPNRGWKPINRACIEPGRFTATRPRSHTADDLRGLAVERTNPKKAAASNKTAFAPGELPVLLAV